MTLNIKKYAFGMCMSIDDHKSNCWFTKLFDFSSHLSLVNTVSPHKTYHHVLTSNRNVYSCQSTPSNIMECNRMHKEIGTQQNSGRRRLIYKRKKKLFCR